MVDRIGFVNRWDIPRVSSNLTLSSIPLLNIFHERVFEMNYPTIEEVESASRYQIYAWYRFLPSPGTRAIGGTRKDFDKVLNEYTVILPM